MGSKWSSPQEPADFGFNRNAEVHIQAPAPLSLQYPAYIVRYLDTLLVSQDIFLVRNAVYNSNGQELNSLAAEIPASTSFASPFADH